MEDNDRAASGPPLARNAPDSGPASAGSNAPARGSTSQPSTFRRRATFLTLDDLDLELLLALAWCAPLTTAQLYRLIDPGMAVRQMRRRLQGLEHSGLVASQLAYHRSAGGTSPRALGKVYGITRHGFECLPDDDRRPVQGAKVRTALLDHDLTVGELVSLVVAHVRPVLSGITIEREVRLDAMKPRPRCDAILTIRHAVPWTTAPPADGETRTGWAIEVDRRTEARSIIREKAEAYKRIWADPAYYVGGRRMPVPLWIVPDARRANAIVREWFAVWPEGRWLMTTVDRLPDLVFTEYRDGGQRMHSLLTGWGL